MISPRKPRVFCRFRKPNTPESASNATEQPISCRDVITKGGNGKATKNRQRMQRRTLLAISFKGRAAFFVRWGGFRVARFLVPSYRRDMGQQHRVRTKRKR